MNSLFAGLPTTIFEVMSVLARQTGAINLGQGFPDDPGPEDIRRKAAEAVLDGYNQYPPMMGLAELRAAVARHYAHWHGVHLDPEREVMITSGATEAIAGALLSLIEPGDEVVLLQTAVAYGLGKDDAFFEEMRADLQRSRDRLADGLRQIGLPPLESQGTYFLNVDLAPLGLNIDDETFCKKLVQERGVALIPVSAFYAENPVTSVVRVCFSKKDATLDAALERLSGLVG